MTRRSKLLRYPPVFLRLHRSSARVALGSCSRLHAKNVRVSERILLSFSVFDVWFRPKAFESERLYERLGALLIKRYVPTGGDLVMQRLRRHHPSSRWWPSPPPPLSRTEHKPG